MESMNKSQLKKILSSLARAVSRGGSAVFSVCHAQENSRSPAPLLGFRIASALAAERGMQILKIFVLNTGLWAIITVSAREQSRRCAAIPELRARQSLPLARAVRREALVQAYSDIHR